MSQSIFSEFLSDSAMASWPRLSTSLRLSLRTTGARWWWWVNSVKLYPQVCFDQYSINLQCIPIRKTRTHWDSTIACGNVFFFLNNRQWFQFWHSRIEERRWSLSKRIILNVSWVVKKHFEQVETAFRSLGLIAVYLLGALMHWQSMVGNLFFLHLCPLHHS